MQRFFITFIRSCFIIAVASVLLFAVSCDKEDELVLSNYTYTKHQINLSRPVQYAIYRDQLNSDDSRVIYYFHGAGGNELTWLDTHKKIISEWQKRGTPIPIVVGLSFGYRILLIPSIEGNENSGYLEYFVEQVIPTIESSLPSPVMTRDVMGFSNGGINAAQVFFRYPELFNKAVILSPAIYTVSPFNDEEIHHLIMRERARRPKIKVFIKELLTGETYLENAIIGRVNNGKLKYFTDPESWDKSNLLLHMERPVTTQNQVYFACGSLDGGGFFSGTEDLVQSAKGLGYNVIWKPFKGGHLIVNQDDIANFLIE